MSSEARAAADRFLHPSIRTDDLAQDIDVIGKGRTQAREASAWWASQVQAVQAIHIARPRLIWEITPSSAAYPVCAECRTTYPCTTIKALDQAAMSMDVHPPTAPVSDVAASEEGSA